MKPIIQKLGVLMAVLWVSVSAFSYDFEVDGDLFFDIISTAELTCKLDSVNENYEGALIIPGSVEYKGKKLTVTSIGTNCIRSCSCLTDIALPATITVMENGCFSYCSSVQKVNLKAIKASVLSEGCFKYSSIKDIIWPVDLVHLPAECFQGCKYLGRLHVPEGVEDIGQGCFALTELESVVFPKSLIKLGESAFWGATIKSSIVLPEELLTINDKAFRGASVPSVYIPSKVSHLGVGVFEFSNVNKVEFSHESNIDTFSDALFYQSTLRDIVFPPHLVSVGDRCFTNCKNISQLNFPNTIESLGNLSLAGLNLDLLCLSENLNYIDCGCFNHHSTSSGIDNTSIKKLIWSVANLNKNLFDAAVNSGKYRDLQYASFYFGPVDECEIGSNCDFLYLGWVELYWYSPQWWHTRYFVFEKSSLQKLTLLDSPNPITLASVLKSSKRGDVVPYEGYLSNDDERIYDYFLSSWMKSLKELYLGREINGNPIYCPNIERLTIGNVHKVDIAECPLPKLKIIECLSETPPKIKETFFSKDQYIDLIIVVPDDAVETYHNADVWKNFWNITSKSDYVAGIDKVSSNAKTESARYDLMGNLVTTNYQGIVIIKYSDGTASKRVISQ